VRVNIIKAIGNHDYNFGRATVFNALGDPNPHVANQASQYFVDHGQPKDATFYWQLAKDSTYSWQTQANLYAAAQRFLPPILADLRDKLNFQHRRKFERATDPYAKAAFLKGLSWFGWNYRYIFRESENVKSPVIRSAAWEALEKISSRPDFARHFGLGWRKVAKDLSQFFRYAMLKGDAGTMVSSATALRLPERGYKEFYTQFGFLDTALTRLTLPRDLETYLEVQKTSNFFKGLKENANLYHYDPSKHPIDWAVLASIGDNPTAVIETSKGEIRISLFPSLAPGSVTNFVKLARSGFYNNKVFHRVVPNFVAQGGCPRGDGYGSLDYAIRTEVPPRYYDDEGYLGMASAGFDTEGTQFFITHSPTPHLDGKYTLFGKVSQGMSIVHTLLIGDVIKKVTIQKQ
jgi:cyclophilin family peptidyl-prolyl cis-trans isomerase